MVVYVRGTSWQTYSKFLNWFVNNIPYFTWKITKSLINVNLMWKSNFFITKNACRRWILLKPVRQGNLGHGESLTIDCQNGCIEPMLDSCILRTCERLALTLINTASHAVRFITSYIVNRPVDDSPSNQLADLLWVLASKKRIVNSFWHYQAWSK